MTPPASAALIAALVLALPGAARAADRDTCREGCYRAGLAAVSSTLGGELDGKTALVSAEVALGLPSVKPGVGISALLGFRSGAMTLDLLHERSWHRTSLAGTRATAALQVYGVSGKLSLMERGPAAALLFLTWIPYAELAVPRDALLASGQLGEARFRRVYNACELGGGVALRPQGFLRLELLASYRFLAFGEARWPGAEWSYTGLLAASGLRASLGVVHEF